MKTSSGLLIILLGLTLSPLAELATGAEDRLARFRPLLADSPFLSLEFKARVEGMKALDLRQVSFHGYVHLPDGWLFALHHAGDNHYDWVKLEETFKEFKIVAFDEKTQQLTLSKDGHEEKLNLSTP